MKFGEAIGYSLAAALFISGCTSNAQEIHPTPTPTLIPTGTFTPIPTATFDPHTEDLENFRLLTPGVKETEMVSTAEAMDWNYMLKNGLSQLAFSSSAKVGFGNGTILSENDWFYIFSAAHTVDHINQANRLNVERFGIPNSGYAEIPVWGSTTFSRNEEYQTDFGVIAFPKSSAPVEFLNMFPQESTVTWLQIDFYNQSTENFSGICFMDSLKTTAFVGGNFAGYDYSGLHIDGANNTPSCSGLGTFRGNYYQGPNIGSPQKYPYQLDDSIITPMSYLKVDKVNMNAEEVTRHLIELAKRNYSEK